jgi:hypothetical protein
MSQDVGSRTAEPNPLEAFLEESGDGTDPFGEEFPEDGFDPFDGTMTETGDDASQPPAEDGRKPNAADGPDPEETRPTAEGQLALFTAPGQEEARDPVEPAQTDPMAAALAKAQASSAQRILDALAAKPPVFSYAAVKDPVADADMTFEDLRARYETDFPELADKKKVSWTLTYGKTTRPVPNPEGRKVWEAKADIENSKAFQDNLKNAKTDKDRNPECLVTPRVTAQSKGDALAKPKHAALVPFPQQQNQRGSFAEPLHGGRQMLNGQANQNYTMGSKIEWMR